MSYAVGVLIVVVGIVASVALHELGHMIPAKRFGALVPRYMVGFGPTLWSTRRGDTEYGLKWILLGGYVNIAGMYAPAAPSTPIYRLGRRRLTRAEAELLSESERRRLQPTLAEEARQSGREDMRAGQEHRAFYNLSAPRKVVVMLGGPVMNLVLALVCITLAVAVVGYRVPSTTLAAVSPCVPPAASGECLAGARGPAQVAGLRAGDRLLTWDGHALTSWQDLREQIAVSGTREVAVTAARAGDTVRTRVRAVAGRDGRPTIGVAAKLEHHRGDAGEVARLTWETASGTVGVVARLPMAVWNTAASLVSGTERDGSGVMSVVGVGRVAGQITAAKGAGITVSDRLGALLSLLGSLNMALFIFNLIPLLPLDGGHVLGAVIEGARRTVARLRGRPDPGPIDIARFTPVTFGVWAVLIVMTLILIAADIWNPVTLG